MKTVERKFIIPFVLVTVCFALWGFANDITNPMVKAFSKIFRMSVTDGALVQVAFYGGYFCMALPAALFIRRFSYKAGVLLGLGLYSAGALMFLPARAVGSYYPFLAAYFILTCGLSFLETSCNPYILSMGDSSTSTRRLNLAQAFNPVGSLAGMFVAMNFIQARLSPLSSSERALLDDAQFEAVKNSDLAVLSKPYLVIGLLLIAVFVLFIFLLPSEKRCTKFSSVEDGSGNGATSHGNDGLCDISGKSTSFSSTVSRLWANRRYRYGVVAQFFYVGVQIMCWTFIIQYGTRIFMNEGMGEQDAEVLSQSFNIAAMVVFCLCRFICTYLLKFCSPSRLLSLFAVVGAVLTLFVIFLDSRAGVFFLVAVSACMSLMFPTIYGISLEGVGEDAKLGAAGLIMAILGGSLLPPLQALIMDGNGLFGISSVNLSFVVPLFCFAVIIAYGVFVSAEMKRERHRESVRKRNAGL